MKFAAGLLSGSIAILADAVNNMSDAASSIITMLGFKMSEKPADREHPFGHARFEYIAGLTVAVLVLVIGFEMGKSSAYKIMDKETVAYGFVSFVVLAFSVFVKAWLCFFNRALGRRIDSRTLAAAAIDSRNDALATTAILMTAVIAHVTGVVLDGWMGLAVALFVLYSGVGLVKETLNPLLGEAPSPELVRRADEKIRSYPGVLGTHDLILHDYGPSRRFASAHVEMPSEMDPLASHDIIDNIERDFLQQEGIHLVLHYDPIVTGSAAVNDARSFVAQRVKEIDNSLTIHDLRMVEGPSNINYIFDIVVPAGFAMSEEELLLRVQALVQHGDKPIHTVITVDQSFAPIQR
jgi:cation diffusion facilitator family transporter